LIFVTTGTNAGAPPFDRLLRHLDGLAQRELLVVQHGASALRPEGAKCVDYVSFDRFEQLVRSARVVVTHAGVGSILVALRNDKHPYVVPRLARHGEHVDDHQLELAQRLDALGAVTLVEDPSALESAVFAEERRAAPAAVGPAGNLADDLAGYLEAVVANGRPRQSSIVV
jgi:UDP-N-acetylglucosamine transferase subunit ALG13